ncbi:MAG: molybdate ABC transporter substrate-binding protein [Oscillospiraceae bacterium]|nr:molybdate ABC transporter substrate-binding protein [Oscillospiraceae bacterium]
MKKILAILLALVMVFALAGCSSTDYTAQLDGIADSLETVQETLEAYIAAEEASAEEEAAEETAEVVESAYSGELIVFAAASMTETLTEIGDLFMEANPDVEIVFNFDSSGTLKTQIEEGADCDVFISAGQKQMDQLDITADESVNTDGLDFVISETRFDILENKVTLAVPDGNPAGIESFDQLAELLAAGDVFLAMGNEDVPVGQYTQLILEYYGLDEEELASSGCITYGSNVKEVTTQVSEATVDCGIIYATDAYSAGLTVVDSATAEMCGQVIYPAAVLNITSNQELAEAFLEFCTSDEASAILESVGFTPLA